MKIIFYGAIAVNNQHGNFSRSLLPVSIMFFLSCVMLLGFPNMSFAKETTERDHEIRHDITGVMNTVWDLWHDGECEQSIEYVHIPYMRKSTLAGNAQEYTAECNEIAKLAHEFRHEQLVYQGYNDTIDVEKLLLKETPPMLKKMGIKSGFIRPIHFRIGSRKNVSLQMMFFSDDRYGKYKLLAIDP